MKKLLIDVIYFVAIVGFIGGGCYNILSVRPDIVVNLPDCIRCIYEYAEKCIEKEIVESNVETNDMKVIDTHASEQEEIIHKHNWKQDTIVEWKSTENGRGNVVFLEVLVCDCGEIMHKNCEE